MSPSATRVGPGIVCQTITFDWAVTEGSCAATMYPLVGVVSAVFAGTGVNAGEPSAFFSWWVASAKAVAGPVELQLASLAAGLLIAQMLAVTKGGVAWLSSKTLAPNVRKLASWPSFGKSWRYFPVMIPKRHQPPTRSLGSAVFDHPNRRLLLPGETPSAP